MGGTGSGGHNRLSDDEKKRRGTFRADRSDAAYDAKATAEIFRFPRLSEIPEPDYTLTSFGRAAYDDWTRRMLEMNRLTKPLVSLASLAAVLKDKIKSRVDAGRTVSTDDIKTLAKLEADMGIAESAPVIGGVPTRSRFADAGFANKRATAFRLR